MTFTNVSLKRDQLGQELLVNGDFDIVDLSLGWRGFSLDKTVRGWKTLNGYQLGPSKYYNRLFKTNHASLDNNYPSMYQTLRFEIEQTEK